MKSVLLVLVALASGAWAQGPSGYWVTAGATQRLVRISPTHVDFFPMVGGRQDPIAVSGDIRTAASGDGTGSGGARYSLNGLDLGMRFNSFQYDGYRHIFYDATTDGRYNYVMNYGIDGGIYRTDRKWGNRIRIAGTPASSPLFGITRDNRDGTLWVSKWEPTYRLIHYWADFHGLDYFQVDAQYGTPSALAMDYSDYTLWYVGYGTGWVVNYSTNGTFIKAVFYPQLFGVYTAGGEFNYVPRRQP